MQFSLSHVKFAQNGSAFIITVIMIIIRDRTNPYMITTTIIQDPIPKQHQPDSFSPALFSSIDLLLSSLFFCKSCICSRHESLFFPGVPVGGAGEALGAPPFGGLLGRVLELDGLCPPLIIVQLALRTL